MESGPPFGAPRLRRSTIMMDATQPFRAGLTFKAVSQLLWSDKDREEWFSLGENHEKASRFGLHPLRNRSSGAALRASMDLVPEAAFLSSKPFPLQIVITKPVASCNKNVPQGLRALVNSVRTAARLTDEAVPFVRNFPWPMH
jgi:hypothetical protein